MAARVRDASYRAPAGTGRSRANMAGECGVAGELRPPGHAGCRRYADAAGLRPDLQADELGTPSPVRSARSDDQPFDTAVRIEVHDSVRRRRQRHGAPELL